MEPHTERLMDPSVTCNIQLTATHSSQMI